MSLHASLIWSHTSFVALAAGSSKTRPEYQPEIPRTSQSGVSLFYCVFSHRLIHWDNDDIAGSSSEIHHPSEQINKMGDFHTN
jgi:hypothetical protein